LTWGGLWQLINGACRSVNPGIHKKSRLAKRPFDCDTPKYDPSISSPCEISIQGVSIAIQRQTMTPPAEIQSANGRRQIDDVVLPGDSMPDLNLPLPAEELYADDDADEDHRSPTAVPTERPPPFSTPDEEAAFGFEALPNYTRRPDPSAPRLPSYARATRQSSRTMTIEQLLPTEEERLASLQAFCEERMYANDFFGGQKGCAEGPPNDPFKLFRWAKRKMSGEKGAVWRKLSIEQREKWEAAGGEAKDGEAAHGDMDTSRII